MIRSLGDESLPRVSLNEAVLQVIGLEVRPGSAVLADTIGRIRWTAYLDTKSLSTTTDSSISFVKLLRSPVPLRINGGDGADATTTQLSNSIESVTIIVGTADGQTFLWDINSDNGASTTQSSRDDTGTDDNDRVCSESSTFCHSTPVHHNPYDATILQAASHIMSSVTVGAVSAVVSRPDGNSFSLVQYVLCTIAVQYVLLMALRVDYSSSSSVGTHPQRGWLYHHPVRPALRPPQSSGPANPATVRTLCQSLVRNTGYIQGTYYLPVIQLLLSSDNRYGHTMT